jgi:hypothetical protein
LYITMIKFTDVIFWGNVGSHHDEVFTCNISMELQSNILEAASASMIRVDVTTDDCPLFVHTSHSPVSLSTIKPLRTAGRDRPSVITQSVLLDLATPGCQPFHCRLLALLCQNILVAGFQYQLRVNPGSLLKLSGCNWISVAFHHVIHVAHHFGQYCGALEVHMVAFIDTMLNHSQLVWLEQAYVWCMFFTPCLDRAPVCPMYTLPHSYFDMFPVLLCILCINCLKWMNKESNICPSSHSEPTEWIVITFYIRGHLAYTPHSVVLFCCWTHL